MLKNLRDILRERAPDLFQRTQLQRNDQNYLTQKQAFGMYRQRSKILEDDLPDVETKKLSNVSTHSPKISNTYMDMLRLERKKAGQSDPVIVVIDKRLPVKIQDAQLADAMLATMGIR